jgi:hypothetical protein
MSGGPKSGDEKAGALPEPPRLPERSAIYIAPDGTVRFGALFQGLVPVAEALSAGALHIKEGGRRPRPAPIVSGESDISGGPIDTSGVPDPTAAGGRP